MNAEDALRDAKTKPFAQTTVSIAAEFYRCDTAVSLTYVRQDKVLKP